MSTSKNANNALQLLAAGENISDRTNVANLMICNINRDERWTHQLYQALPNPPPLALIATIAKEPTGGSMKQGLPGKYTGKISVRRPYWNCKVVTVVDKTKQWIISPPLLDAFFSGTTSRAVAAAHTSRLPTEQPREEGRRALHNASEKPRGHN